MSLFCKLIIFIFLTIFSMTAKAQISVHPPPPDTPVCVEKKDAYVLALADMQNTLSTKWETLVAEGRCRFMPARYLYTIDNYKDNVNTPSRVVELLVYGERVWGIRSTLPVGVWTIQHEHHPQDKPLHDIFYDKWNVPNQGNPRRYSCCNKQDCYPTPIKFEDGKYWALRREDLKWLLVPQDRLEQLQQDTVESPDHQSHACISPPSVGDNVYCATLGEGA